MYLYYIQYLYVYVCIDRHAEQEYIFNIYIHVFDFHIVIYIPNIRNINFTFYICTYMFYAHILPTLHNIPCTFFMASAHCS